MGFGHTILLEIGELTDCIIVERISRFSVKVIVNGCKYAAHINNTGRLPGYIVGGRRGFCIPTPGRGLSYRLLGVEDDGYAALIDTKLHEKSFETLVSRNLIPWLRGCRISKRNANLYGSTVDYAILCSDREVFVELKSAVMDLGSRVAGYPDAPTTRGRRQIAALANYARGGGSSYIVFIAGIPNAKGFQLYCNIDRAICNAIRYAIESGVVFKSINVFLNPSAKSIVYGDLDLPIDLGCCRASKL